MGKYGELGKDVGVVGRWGRLFAGILMVLYSILIIFNVLTESSQPLFFLGSTFLYFILILGVYTAAYHFFGERFFAKAHPWVNTLILVIPAVIGLFWNDSISPLIGFELPWAFVLALNIYIGVSLLLQWKTKYGGCEVVSIPGILLGKKYKTYCVAFIPLDYVEKKIVERNEKTDKTN